MNEDGGRRGRQRGDGGNQEAAESSAREPDRYEARYLQRRAKRIAATRADDAKATPAAPFERPEREPDERERQIQRLIDGITRRPSTDVQNAAARGTSGAAGPLPYLEQIQRSFGRHDVAHVQAHTDAAAAAGAEAMGARAFATGDHVAFNGAPDLHTAAHEAAHVVQQRGGVQLKGGVGEDGDAYERHADAVADRVVAGQSAEALLDQHAGAGSSGAAVQRAPSAMAWRDRLNAMSVRSAMPAVQRAPKDTGAADASGRCEPMNESVALSPEEQAEVLRREQAGAAALPQHHGVDVSQLSKAGKIEEAIKRSGKYLGPEVAAKIQSLVTPEALKMLTLVLVGGAVVQAIPVVGEAADAALAAWAIYALGNEAIHACKEIFAFVKGALAAGSEAALDEAGHHFANFVATVGVDAAVAFLVHKAAKDVSGGVNKAGEVLAEGGPPGPTGLAPATAGGPSLAPIAASGYRVLADGTIIPLAAAATGAALAMSQGGGREHDVGHSDTGPAARSDGEAAHAPSQAPGPTEAVPRPGSIDETAGKFSDRERPVAVKLASEGRRVEKLPEASDLPGRKADALVDGTPTEFKQLDPGATDSTVKNNISASIKRGGQARDMVIDARGSGLSEHAANHGLNRATGIARGLLDSVRILGDGFDIERKF